MQNEVIARIRRTGVIVIVRGVRCGYCELAEALCAGGVEAMELTFSPGAPETFAATAGAIAELRARMGERMCIGAGTVTEPRLVGIAAEAGAQFIVSPNVDVEVIGCTKRLGMVSIPGAMTPTEIVAAHRAGADFVKVFPAGELGADYLRAVAAPLGYIPMLAVEGITPENAADFRRAGCVGVGVGGYLADHALIRDGRFEEITARAKRLVTSLRA